jgi:N-acetylneuraminic acid mutarotase
MAVIKIGGAHGAVGATGTSGTGPTGPSGLIGPTGPTGAGTAGAGSTMYLTETQSDYTGDGKGDLVGFKYLEGSASYADEAYSYCVCDTLNVPSKIETFVTRDGEPGTMLLPAGDWTFTVYAKRSTTETRDILTRDTSHTKLLMSLYKLEYQYDQQAGWMPYNSTELGNYISPDLSTSYAEYTFTISVGSDTVLGPHDRICITFYGQASNTLNDHVIIAYQGVENISRFVAPINLRATVNSSAPVVTTSPYWAIGSTGGIPRIFSSAIVYGSKLYVWSGEDENSGAVDTMNIYDFTQSEWSLLTYSSGPTPRYNYSAVLYNSQIYYFGGYDSDGNYITNLDTYNCNNGEWAFGSMPSTNRAEHIAVVYDGKMYVWGGYDSDSNLLNTLDVYDFAIEEWSSATNGGTARSGACALVYDGKMYVWGGTDDSSCPNTLDIYDFATDIWSTGTSGGTGRLKPVCAEYNGKLYFWSGKDFNADLVSSMDVYDVAMDSWSIGAVGGTPREAPCFGVYESKLYVWGGKDSNNAFLDTMDVFSFPLINHHKTHEPGGADEITKLKSGIIVDGPMVLKQVSVDPSPPPEGYVYVYMQNGGIRQQSSGGVVDSFQGLPGPTGPVGDDGPSPITDNIFKIGETGASPTADASNYQLYIKSDGKLYIMSPTGAESVVGTQT